MGAHGSAEGIARSTPKQAYDFLAGIDPTKFYRKFGPLPAVVAVRDQDGSWDTVGRTRRLPLSDGGHVIETITDTQSPSYFAYELRDFQKLFGMLVHGARAEWRFEGVESGTSIHWTYVFFGKPGRGWIVWVIVRLFWAPYMKQVLAAIVAEVERQS